MMYNGRIRLMFIVSILLSVFILHTANCDFIAHAEQADDTIDLSTVKTKLIIESKLSDRYQDFFLSGDILSIFEGTVTLDQSPVYIIIGFSSGNVTATLIPVENTLPELPPDQWYELYIRDEEKEYEWYELTAGPDIGDYPVISFEYDYDGVIPENVCAILCVYSNDGQLYSYKIESVMKIIPKS